MNQTEKIVLGGGGYCTYAPRFPRYQTSPGFFDDVSIYNATVRPLYALHVLRGGVPVTLSCTGVERKDGCAVLTFKSGDGVKLIETRMVTTDDRFVSKVEVTNETKTETELVLVQWTTVDPEGEAVSLEGDSFRVRRTLQPDDTDAIPVEIVWSSPDSKGARCIQAMFGEGGSDRPDYEETPWFELEDMPTPRAKRPMVKPSPIVPTSRVYAGVFRPIKLKGGATAKHRFEANVIFKGKGINYRPRRPDPKDENGYSAFMDKAPRFVCEDKRLERLVRHRFETLHVLRLPNGVGNMSAHSVCEGDGDLHVPCAFTAPSILREARWLTDPSLARGVLRSFFENIRQSGMVPGHIRLVTMPTCGFYHADWGGGFEALDAIHPDRATKRAVLMAMQRYVKWLANNRDPEGSGLTDVVNQRESGQRMSRRFTLFDDKCDRAEDFGEHFRVKAVDASIFRYRLVRYLAQVADEVQEKAMANRFIAETEVIHDVIRKRLWDEKTKLFMDVDPKTRRKTGVKSAVGFYPLATDVPKPAQVDGLLASLSDRKEFWSKYPVPTVGMSDPSFSADGQWKGTRATSPWNGRTWGIVNSHILEGLAYVAERGNKKAQKLCGDLFERTVAMMSGQLEDREQANSCAHFHPITGRGNRASGTGCTTGTFILDNIFRIGCGFAVRFGEVQDDPVIKDMPDFKLQDLPVGNKRYTVERKGSKLKIAQQ